MATSKDGSTKDQSTNYDVESLKKAEREALADSLMDEYMSED